MTIRAAISHAVVAIFIAASAIAAPTPRIAIIIDDLGWQLAPAQRVVDLPGPVACAVLPETPLGAKVTELAHAKGKDVLLHLPLQAMNHEGLGEPGIIMLDTSRKRFAATFAADLAAVPHAIGINSHRGSLLTRHPGHMRWLMEEIGARGDLFFVDSYTTHLSVALSVAEELGVPARKRDVFLDSDESLEGIAREFERLKALARANGTAIAIGHPYAMTLTFLESALPELDKEGIKLVGIRELVMGSAVETLVDANNAGEWPQKGEER